MRKTSDQDFQHQGIIGNGEQRFGVAENLVLETMNDRVRDRAVAPVVRATRISSAGPEGAAGILTVSVD